MTKEEAFFLDCLADFCQKRSTKKPDKDINFERVLYFAQIHSLASIIFYQCKKWLKETDVYENFHDAYLYTIFRSVNRTDMMKEIVSRLGDQDIDILCMKGAVLRNYYPVPELRSMGDIDFIVHEKDQEKVSAIMMNDMGFKRYIDNHAVWIYHMNRFIFEVHNKMFYETLISTFDYIDYFQECWKHCHKGSVFNIEADNLWIPDDNFHFLYLMTHTAKHIINKGSGFRSYLDMVLMCQTYDLDWEWITEELSRLKLLDFTKTCFSLCEKWFHVSMPLESIEMDEAFYSYITRKTFDDGCFGHQNKKENEAAKYAKVAKHSNHTYATSMLKLTLKRLFPSYRDMQLVPAYAFVDQKPWLLPAAWIYRWGYCITHKLNHSIHMLFSPATKMQEIDMRAAYLDEWGFKK